jgi:hypothetical protein
MDLIWTSQGVPIVVSDRVIGILSEEGFTGWDTYPVTVVGQDGRVIENYRGLAITGRCGPLDSSMSLVVLRQYPAGTFPVRRGRFFDPSTWDGSDLFMPQRPAEHVFALAEVRVAFNRARIRNVEFQRIDELEWSDPSLPS